MLTIINIGVLLSVAVWTFCFFVVSSSKDKINLKIPAFLLFD
jgi:hypothetical protein